MTSDSAPLVTIVTPVYNTEKYLEECIESVIAQTYANWEYVIVDNRSTDASGEIAARYAARDPRIRVHTNETFLSQMENWNHALRMVSPGSAYCKIVHADDWMFPDCIEKMVACAEEHPTVGIVGSYRLDETEVDLDGLPYPSPVTAGHDIGRRYLLEHLYLFGAPTSLLVRSEIVRERDPFYDEENLHADVDACLHILRDHDFGFVHDILTYTRRHNESTSSKVERFSTRRLARLAALENHGPVYLETSELEARRRQQRSAYYRFLARQALELREKAFWDFQRAELEKMGIPLRYGALAKALALEILDLRGSAKHVIQGLRRRFRTKPGGRDDGGMGAFRKESAP